jgi:hypothetical protein
VTELGSMASEQGEASYSGALPGRLLPRARRAFFRAVAGSLSDGIGFSKHLNRGSEGLGRALRSDSRSRPSTNRAASSKVILRPIISTSHQFGHSGYLRHHSGVPVPARLGISTSYGNEEHRKKGQRHSSAGRSTARAQAESKPTPLRFSGASTIRCRTRWSALWSSRGTRPGHCGPRTRHRALTYNAPLPRQSAAERAPVGGGCVLPRIWAHRLRRRRPTVARSSRWIAQPYSALAMSSGSCSSLRFPNSIFGWT